MKGFKCVKEYLVLNMKANGLPMWNRRNVGRGP